MKLTLTLALSTLILSAAAMPISLTSVFSKRHGGPPGGPGDWNHGGNNNGQQQNNNNNNQNNGGHDALWNGVYEQTPNCTPADGVATDGNQFWADNCDLGAGEDGFGQ